MKDQCQWQLAECSKEPATYKHLPTGAKVCVDCAEVLNRAQKILYNRGRRKDPVLCLPIEDK